MSERIDAENLGQARYILDSRGYRDVQFFDDENADDLREMTEAGCNVPAVPAELWTPADEIESCRTNGAWRKFWWAFKQHLFIFIPLFLWNICALRTGRPYSWGDRTGFMATFLYLGYFVLIAAPSQVFHQILDASVWKDWRRLRIFIRVARMLRAVLRMGIPESELRIREAYALADEGRLDDALQLMETVRADPNGKHYLYLGRLASVYEHAGAYDRQIVCLREAQQQGSGGASEWIDLAMALALRGHDVSGAKQALAAAKEMELPVIAKAFVAWCEGLIALEENDFLRAKIELRAALESTQSIGNQLMVGVRALIKAFLCIACAHCGEGNEAQKLWTECSALLVARKETALTQRCRAALARFTTQNSA